MSSHQQGRAPQEKEFQMRTRTIPLFVGIDVSKANLDVFVHPSGESFRAANVTDGIADLTARMRKIKPVMVVLEATAGFERKAARALASAGIRVAVVNPRQVRDFAKAMGELAKTDAIDSAVIAQFAEAIKPKPRPLPDEQAQNRDALETRRRQLVGLLAMERNHLATSPPELRDAVTKHIRHLQELIKDVEAQLHELIAADPELSAKATLLQSVKGIGEVTSTALIVNLPELGSLDRRGIAKLAGVGPLNDDSGKRTGKRSCWGGRRDVRTAMYMPTLSAVKYNPVIKPFYDSLVARGKPHKVAMVACIRKLLTILNAMVRNNSPWTPELAFPR